MTHNHPTSYYSPSYHSVPLLAWPSRSQWSPCLRTCWITLVFEQECLLDLICYFHSYFSLRVFLGRVLARSLKNFKLFEIIISVVQSSSTILQSLLDTFPILLWIEGLCRRVAWTGPWWRCTSEELSLSEESRRGRSVKNSHSRWPLNAVDAVQRCYYQTNYSFLIMIIMKTTRCTAFFLFSIL